MRVILSPARNTLPQGREGLEITEPLFLREAGYLAEKARGYSPWRLESLLDLNPLRALELHDQYQRFDISLPGTPALLTYQGAAFRNMDPGSFDSGDLSFAQGRLWIISALYGLLRPLDGILPHRLGLKKDFPDQGQTLYGYWGDKLSQELFREEGPVLNLASEDYGKLIGPRLAKDRRVVSVRFLTRHPEGVRGTVAEVRAARGRMARCFVRRRAGDPEEMKEFRWNGYAFSPWRSGSNTYVFVRDKGPGTGEGGGEPEG
jgi:cytoplasmic iron level regulating protein YaaA (DUF328/UPF0246 family)